MIERAQPHLGTLVQIGVAGLETASAHHAIEAGFAAIAEIHRLMSFHEAASDVSRLNTEAVRQPTQVSPHTYAVISKALEISAATNGVFDITVAPQLVAWGVLPSPASPPDPTARWGDIELLAGNQIRFHKPLWVDLGGIAKGYAVDHAFRQMALAPDIQCKVNAGGDLRVAGAAPERIRLRVEGHDGAQIPVIELQGASLASSSGTGALHEAGLSPDGVQGCHIHGVSRSAIGLDNFVSVVAEECMIADALTKVVLALGGQSADILNAFGATAYCFNAKEGWQVRGVRA